MGDKESTTKSSRNIVLSVDLPPSSKSRKRLVFQYVLLAVDSELDRIRLLLACLINFLHSLLELYALEHLYAADSKDHLICFYDVRSRLHLDCHCIKILELLLFSKR